MKECPNCGARVYLAGANYCESCGSALEVVHINKKCPKCGAFPATNDALFCSMDGTALVGISDSSEEGSKTLVDMPAQQVVRDDAHPTVMDMPAVKDDGRDGPQLDPRD